MNRDWFYPKLVYIAEQYLHTKLIFFGPDLEDFSFNECGENKWLPSICLVTTDSEAHKRLLVIGIPCILRKFGGACITFTIGGK
ncbi:hypothetical protein [Anaeroselena agilis]|uniref:Uncharacterized protein n=1 Tax=Anaeroselena agilis TaxID=3063788 RepID=A0ABU3NWZ1_9FIRM|nr:hypothetical protein [Selenomonadales bacterium 4137-cl]